MIKPIAILAALAVSILATPSLSQETGKNLLAARDAAEAPILSFLRSRQVKLTYLGNDGGVKGYFGESASGSMQTFYVFPDGDHVLAGVLFLGSDNVTSRQVDAMQRRFEGAAVRSGLGDGIDPEKASGIGEMFMPPDYQYDTPSADVSPALDFMRAKGVEFTDLGIDGGLRGYLGKASTGRLQAFYEAPDRKHVLAGTVLNLQGINVTGVQVGELRARFAASVEAASPSPSGEQAAAEDSPPSEVHQAVVNDSSVTGSGDLLIPEASASIDGEKGSPSELWRDTVDRDEFMAAAEKTAYFDVGSNSAPLTVWKFADPNCPYCHAAWDYMKDLVRARKIKVRIVGVGVLDGSHDKMMDILASPSPGRVWLNSNGGRSEILKPEVEDERFDAARRYMQANMDFARALEIDGTPFLAYEVGGKFYASRGLPKDMGLFLEAGVPLNE
ncbi:thioredoxin fold domain-containing protein [Roseibium sp. RKSG952]|uniref:thioredoxin fold domain-containing protein n=1 Tax=Roseibium sp. RKSG952 TaxID=2529384 RepID=UPI0012BBAA21|nr:thioredoxin fold domain-containing protein [Roseibium sp. RKSG952]MTH94830.1 hypothetical protein [Roseibium sp. RKSG952]